MIQIQCCTDIKHEHVCCLLFQNTCRNIWTGQKHVLVFWMNPLLHNKCFKYTCWASQTVFDMIFWFVHMNISHCVSLKYTHWNPLDKTCVYRIQENSLTVNKGEEIVSNLSSVLFYETCSVSCSGWTMQCSCCLSQSPSPRCRCWLLFELPVWTWMSPSYPEALRLLCSSGWKICLGKASVRSLMESCLPM